MSSLKTMLDGFAALASSLTGLPNPQVVQTHMPVKAIDPTLKARLEFRILAVRSVSEVADEVRYVVSGVDDEFLDEVVSGMRVVTIQVKCIGLDHRPGQDAIYYLERMGNRMAWPATLDALSALEMALVARHPTIDVSTPLTADDRTTSVAVKDFLFNAVVNEISNPGDEDEPGWIETVEFYSQDWPNGDPDELLVSGSVTRPPDP